jgi:hypothetical protein
MVSSQVVKELSLIAMVIGVAIVPIVILGGLFLIASAVGIS